MTSLLPSCCVWKRKVLLQMCCIFHSWKKNKARWRSFPRQAVELVSLFTHKGRQKQQTNESSLQLTLNCLIYNNITTAGGTFWCMISTFNFVWKMCWFFCSFTEAECRSLIHCSFTLWHYLNWGCESFEPLTVSHILRTVQYKVLSGNFPWGMVLPAVRRREGYIVQYFQTRRLWL